MNDTINRYLAILCYPYASLDFFQEDFFAEIINSAQSEKEIKKIKGRLKDKLVQYMQRNYSIYSYDEIYLYLEKCYLYELQINKNTGIESLYYGHLMKIVKTMISQRDGKIVFKYWESSQSEKFFGGFGAKNKIFLFYSMNMHMPMDFLVMLYAVQNFENGISCLNNYFGQIEIADQQLDAILKKGVAENHLHNGVSLAFSDIWEGLMLPVKGEDKQYYENLRHKLSDGIREGAEIFFLIFSAAVIRIYLVLSIKGQYLTGVGNNGENELQQLIMAFQKGNSLKRLYEEKCAYDKTIAAVVGYFVEIWDILLSSIPAVDKEHSVLYNIFELSEEVHTSEENIFLFYMMRFWKEREDGSYKKYTVEDKKIVHYFMQYLRIKNYMFGCTVQTKTVRGLDYFQTHYYKKDSALNGLLGSLLSENSKWDKRIAYWERAMRKQFQNRYLKKIEFRASIDENENEFRGNVRAFLCAYRNVLREDYCRKEDGVYRVYREIPRVGIVYHLLKRKDDTVPEKCFLDSKEDIGKEYFGLQERQYKDLVDIMRKLRDEISGLERYIVGIDAASLENNTPVWVFSDVYERARDSRIEELGYTMSFAQSLRFTFHAGEDFRHILSGLRRVDEAVSFLKFHAGDRIGHGTALGVSVEKWKIHNPFVVMPRIEALENYIWAYYVLSQDSINFQSTLMAYLERRAYDLAKEIYGSAQGISIMSLVEGYLLLFSMDKEKIYKQCEAQEDAGFCKEVQNQRSEDISWNGKKIALARHCKKFLQEMERPIDYEVTEQDIEITRTLQKMVKRKLSKNGIVVEINPSSNISIGEVDKITDNQIYQLNQPDASDNVMVCINSDDPMVFNTNVSNELSYIYYGMLHSSVSREKAIEWIDKVRECGMDSSFIQNRESDQEAYELLEEIIKKL